MTTDITTQESTEQATVADGNGQIDLALRALLTSIASNEERWAQLSRDGATDREIRAAVTGSVGPNGRSGSQYGVCTLKVRPKIAFWFGSYGAGEPTLESQALVNKLREVFAIPTPDGDTSDADAATLPTTDSGPADSGPATRITESDIRQLEARGWLFTLDMKGYWKGVNAERGLRTAADYARTEEEAAMLALAEEKNAERLELVPGDPHKRDWSSLSDVELKEWQEKLRGQVKKSGDTLTVADDHLAIVEELIADRQSTELVQAGITESDKAPELEKASMQLSLFDYAQLDEETAGVIKRHTREIRSRIVTNLLNSLDIGQRVREVKGILGRGKFDGWLASEIGFSRDSAERFIRLADYADEHPHFAANLKQFDKTAVHLLLAPSIPEEAREEAVERATAGERITSGTAREIITAHKEPAADTPAISEQPLDMPSESTSSDAEIVATGRTDTDLISLVKASQGGLATEDLVKMGFSETQIERVRRDNVVVKDAAGKWSFVASPTDQAPASRPTSAPDTPRPLIEALLKGRMLSITYTYLPALPGLVTVGVCVGEDKTRLACDTLDSSKVRGLPERVMEMVAEQLKAAPKAEKPSSSKTSSSKRAPAKRSTVSGALMKTARSGGAAARKAVTAKKAASKKRPAKAVPAPTPKKTAPAKSAVNKKKGGGVSAGPRPR